MKEDNRETQPIGVYTLCMRRSSCGKDERRCYVDINVDIILDLRSQASELILGYVSTSQEYGSAQRPNKQFLTIM